MSVEDLCKRIMGPEVQRCFQWNRSETWSKEHLQGSEAALLILRDR